MTAPPPTTSSAILRGKLALARVRIEAAEARDRATAATGGLLGRLGRRVVLHVHRGEEVDLPAPAPVGDRVFDVLDDLERYTKLPRREIDALVSRRSDSFRAEWFLTPARRRLDDWFYLSSTTYLFGNAVHDARSILSLVHRHARTQGRALDFGGGTGNLALALAAEGWSVDYLEHSALQKDFVSFRVDRHKLQDRVHVLHDWSPLEEDAYDLVAAIDVLEHVADLAPLLEKRLLPAIRQGGFLVESSPFSRSLSNPMHHEHEGLELLLTEGGFRLVDEQGEGRVWQRRGPQQLRAADDSDQIARTGSGDGSGTGS